MSQGKEFTSLFYVWEDTRVWDCWNDSFDVPLCSLGPVSHLSPSRRFKRLKPRGLTLLLTYSFIEIFILWAPPLAGLCALGRTHRGATVSASRCPQAASCKGSGCVGGRVCTPSSAHWPRCSQRRTSVRGIHTKDPGGMKEIGENTYFFLILKNSTHKQKQMTKDPIIQQHPAILVSSTLFPPSPPQRRLWNVCLLKCTQLVIQVCVRPQSCLTLRDGMDCSPPGSSVYGTFQARTLEWAALSFSRGSSRPRDRTHISRISCRQIFHH